VTYGNYLPVVVLPIMYFMYLLLFTCVQFFQLWYLVLCIHNFCVHMENITVFRAKRVTFAGSRVVMASQMNFLASRLHFHISFCNTFLYFMFSGIRSTDMFICRKGRGSFARL
jgi:hypothetical protein